MTNLALLIIGALAVWGVSRYIDSQRADEPEEPPETYDTAELVDAIRALYALTFRLENADRMLADLATCDPAELLRGFRTEWVSTDGKRREIDFLATGANDATAGLRTAAQEQRDQINAEIIEAVRALNAAITAGCAPVIVCDVVEKTIEKTTAAATVGECGSDAAWMA